jgi:hypothetical protein
MKKIKKRKPFTSAQNIATKYKDSEYLTQVKKRQQMNTPNTKQVFKLSKHVLHANKVTNISKLHKTIVNITNCNEVFSSGAQLCQYEMHFQCSRQLSSSIIRN